MRQKIKLSAKELACRLIDGEVIYFSGKGANKYYQSDSGAFIYDDGSHYYPASEALRDGGTFYIEKPWYENIPEHGVLCHAWQQHSETKFIARVLKKLSSTYGSYAVEGDSFFDYAEPLTDEEIKKFLRGDK